MTKKSRRVAKARRMLLTLSLVLVVAFAAVSGTVAWLTSKTDPVTNTFSVGDIEITLHESPYDRATNTIDTSEEVMTNTNYKIIPGTTMPKDPTVTVLADSEDCWLFVKVDVTKWPAQNVTYGIAQGWTELTSAAADITDGTSKVYYREVASSTSNSVFDVLANNQIVVSENLTEAQMEAITAPQMVFTAYAVQKENVGTAAEAWAKLNP